MADNDIVFAFDLGNVLFGFDYTVALKKIETRIDVSIDFLLGELYNNQFGLSFEKGLASPREFYTDFKDRFKARLDFDEFVSIWCDIFYPKNDVIGLAKNLLRRHSCYVISNINELHFTFLNRRYPDVFNMFDGLILSYEVKSIKPEPEIYQALCQKAATEFQNIIYIDDRKDLIEAARSLRLRCILFESYSQLVNDISFLGIACG